VWRTGFLTPGIAVSPAPIFQTLPNCPLSRSTAAHAQEGAIFVGALFQYFATGEDPAALLLGRPGQE